MGQELTLLDEALDLARREIEALEDGAYEDALELAEKRGMITNMAWNEMPSGNREECRGRILELADLQGRLTAIATKARNAIRERLNSSRKEKKRIQGYHLAVNQALQ